MLTSLIMHTRAGPALNRTSGVGGAGDDLCSLDPKLFTQLEQDCDQALGTPHCARPYVRVHIR